MSKTALIKEAANAVEERLLRIQEVNNLELKAYFDSGMAKLKADIFLMNKASTHASRQERPHELNKQAPGITNLKEPHVDMSGRVSRGVPSEKVWLGLWFL